MKIRYYLLFIITINFFSYAQLPAGFGYAKHSIPDIKVDLRYFGNNNFIGKPIDGYHNNCLILSKETLIALKAVQQELKSQNLGLKIFDGYRPQRAVNHFVRWAKNVQDTLNKSKFYPDVKKKDLFRKDYIASRSGHTKGSTVDVTLINLSDEKELDMGSNFDFFGVQSWVTYTKLSNTQKLNRALLQSIMLKHGFKNYLKEWWHFTLKNEPFKNTYFNFPIE